MKTRWNPILICRLGALLLPVFNGVAQPVIVTQPTNQIVLNGSNVIFSVGVSGTGPFTYQWEFNGTNLPNDLITTVAGNGVGGYSGDGILATQSSLHYPLGLTVDTSGNLFIADNYNERIRKVDASGIITTVAGSGSAGYSGDSGVATNSSLTDPTGVAVDSAGIIFFVDSGNNRLCKVTGDGQLTSVVPRASNNLYNPLGMAIDQSGYLYIADASNNRVVKINQIGTVWAVAGDGDGSYYGDGGLATLAGVHQPFGVAVDNAGNMFIAESSSGVVRKVDTNGIINTVAATMGNLSEPYGVAVDSVGNIFIADTWNGRIRKVDTNGILSTVAGGGINSADNISAADSSLNIPEGVAVDASGNLFIADTFNNRIREVEHPGPRLVLNNLSTNNAGYYCVIISNSSGSITSSIANLTVVLPPNIAMQPQGQQIVAGTNVTFSVSVGGTAPLHFQWQLNGTNIQSATNSIYSIGTATPDFAGDYSVTITNSYGSITSSIATLAMVPLNITEQPQSQHILAGSNAVFNVSVISTQPVNYQWQFNGTDISGATGPIYQIGLLTTDRTGDYSVIITNLYGSVTSSVAALTVDVMDITNQPRSQSILAGSNVTFSVSGNLLAPVDYQWQFNGTNIAGATNSSYSIAPVTTAEAGNYAVVITNIYGCSTSSVAVLTVLVLPPSITLQPSAQEVHPGSTATFSVTASGTAPLNYQWFSTTMPLDNQTNSILSLLNVSPGQAGSYKVVITNAYGSTTSQVALLVIGHPPTITLQPTNQTVLIGSRTLIVAGATGDGSLTFQWQLNGTNLPNNLITTIAGNGTSGFAGDGGIATTGKISAPYGLAADNSGNLFFADSGNYRIRKVDVRGMMTTVAGTGVASFFGDGGAATNARLSTSYGVAADTLGNLFIADTANNRIRKVDTNGIIKTVAGRTGSGFSGDGGAATNATLSSPYGVIVDLSGNLYIADTGNNRVRKVDTNGVIATVAGKSGGGFSGDGGAATNASLSAPRSVAMDSAGNLLIADANNYRIRKVDTYGVISTIAGNGTQVYSGDNGMATNAGVNPYAVAVDSYGDVLIADRSNNRIRQMDPYGIITTLAGTNGFGYNGDGMAAINAKLYSPSGVTMDSYGRVMVADTANNRIRRFGQGPTFVLDAASATNAGDYTLVVSSSFGSVTSSPATLTVLLPPVIVSQPASQSIALGSNAVFTVTATGTLPFYYFWRTNGVNQSGQTNQSLNLANVQWSDAGSYQVVITNNYGSVTSAVATLTVGLPPSIVSQPTNLTVVAGNNGLLSVAVAGDGPFSYQWQLNGTNLPPIITTVAGTNGFGFSGDGGPATNARLNNPFGVAVNAAGEIFIADNSNYRVRKVDTNGIISSFAGTGAYGYTGNGGRATNATLGQVQAVTLDVAGNLFVADYGEVRKVGTNGVITCVAGTGGGGYSNDGGVATNTVLFGATGVAVDGQGNVFLDDYYSYRVRKVGTNGILTTVAGITAGGVVSGFSGDGGMATNANLSTSFGVALDAAGDIFVSDTGNNRIRKVDTSGIINTIIGGGATSTDGLQGTNTYLFSPQAVVVDPGKNVFVTSSGRIRKMDTNGIMTTVAGGGSHNPGDYGPATSAVLLSPKGIALDTLGNLYIADAGGSRIRKVHNSGDPTLQLLNVSPGNSGIYSVVITSPFGSVASSAATFTVVVTPTIQISGPANNGQFSFSWNTTSNVTYQMEYTTNLISPNWINLGSPVTATNNSGSASDVLGADEQRFYRVLLLP